ncbi:MAG: hypothetical protein KDA60_10320 [Planctomycetales bacterium]|nr:hypothetical protein [Planctomycetales bacterium]
MTSLPGRFDLMWLPRYFLLCFWFVLLGCGPVAAPPHTIADAQKAYDDALTAAQSGDDQRVVDLLTVALDSQVLNADQAGMALLHRAVARANLKAFPAAHADLDEAGPGVAEEDLYIVRHYVLTQEGKPSEAAAALSQAKKFNPDVQMPSR